MGKDKASIIKTNENTTPDSILRIIFSLKSFINILYHVSVYKNYIFISLFFILNISIYAKEPTLAILRSVQSNEYQKFSIGMYEFICRPYGVLTLQQLHKKADTNSSCQKAIEVFFKKNPLDKYYAQNLLKQSQTYHVEFKDSMCVLYASGKMSMSELLLKKGLALNILDFEDKEFKHSFKNAQNYAKNKKVGLFKEKIQEKCLPYLETKN